MKIGKITPSFGVLRNVTSKGVGVSELKIIKGSFKDQNVTIFKEYYGNKLDLKLYWITDKLGRFIKAKLQHIGNGRVIWERIHTHKC